MGKIGISTVTGTTLTFMLKPDRALKGFSKKKKIVQQVESY